MDFAERTLRGSKQLFFLWFDHLVAMTIIKVFDQSFERHKSQPTIPVTRLRQQLSSARSVR